MLESFIPQCPDAFQQGFWLRTIEHPDMEVAFHRNDYYGNTQTVSASFMLPGNNIDIYNPYRPGIILLPRNRVIHWWYDGAYGHKISNMMELDSSGYPAFDEYNRPFNNKPGIHQGITEQDIYSTMLKNIHSMSNTGCIPHNETKFRYHISEIDAFYVNTTQESIRFFLILRKKLAVLHPRLMAKPVYAYQQGILRRINKLEYQVPRYPIRNGILHSRL